MNKKDTILIAGLGAIGSVIYARLREKKHNIIALTSERGKEAIRKKGLMVKLQQDLSPKLHKVEVYSNLPNKYKFKSVIITSKAYHNSILAEYLVDFIEEESSILLFQNGLKIEEPFLKADKNWKITRAVSSIASFRDKEGKVTEISSGLTMLGGVNCDEAELQKWRVLLSSIGLEVTIPDDFKKRFWLKIIANSSINPLGAITKLRNGEIIKDKQLLRIIGNIIDEILLVIKNEIRIPYSEVFNYVLDIAKETAENKCSMLQDRERGVRTEIDFLNGEIIRIAKHKNIAVPINEGIVSIVYKLINKEEPEELILLELRSLL
ncbi:MAG: ketopantoate reductase family protein [Candidatus Heimdallarchaeaceae archaeon]